MYQHIYQAYLIKKHTQYTTKSVWQKQFIIDLPVVSGFRIGTKIGIPTINQILPEKIISPGVYGTFTKIKNRWCPSITCVWHSQKKLVSETHVIKKKIEHAIHVAVAYHFFLRTFQTVTNLWELKKIINFDMIIRQRIFQKNNIL